jgi:hypothetical protein
MYIVQWVRAINTIITYSYTNENKGVLVTKSNIYARDFSKVHVCRNLIIENSFGCVWDIEYSSILMREKKNLDCKLYS